MSTQLQIGTAGWAIPRASAEAFPAEGSGLARYASVFNAVEINATFYREPRQATLERWQESVPAGFRFAVKVPKTITHELRLAGAGLAFAQFVEAMRPLEPKLGPMLLQLPPKLAIEAAVVEQFLREAQGTGARELVVEPRHPSWFGPEAEALLRELGVARAGADPERGSGALGPGGARQLTYLRLHGSPRVYFSAYDDAMLEEVRRLLLAAEGPAWCIFDNTASGAAAADALRLLQLMRAEAPSAPG